MKYNPFKQARSIITSTIVLTWLAALLPGTIQLNAQTTDVYCSPYWPKNSCIDMTDPNPVAITLPQNHNRIPPGGFNLCLPSLGPSVSTPVDIVFVLDQSGSMESNDQEFYAPAAVREAIDTLRAKSPQSSVGFLGFANGLCDGTQTEDNQWSAGERYDARGTPASNTLIPPAPLTDAQYNALAYQTGYGPGNYYMGCGANIPSGTYYGSAFQQAVDWLPVPGLDPLRPKIIIFVTDGQPHPGHDSLQTLFDADMALFEGMVMSATPSTFPEVYSIFIGGSNSDLNTLADNTGGRAISLGNSRELAATINSIIDGSLVVIPGTPLDTPLVTNISAVTGGVTQQLASLSHQQTGGSYFYEYNVVFNNMLFLGGGINTITFITTTKSGVAYSKILYLNVSGLPETKIGLVDYPGLPYSAQCGATPDFTSVLPEPGMEFNSVEFGEKDFHNLRLYNLSGQSIRTPKGIYLLQQIDAPAGTENKLQINR